MESARCISRSLKSHTRIRAIDLAHCNLGSNPEILSVILQSDVKDISLIPHALVAVVNKLAHFFTASRDNNPPLLELLHESITQRYWPPFDVHRWLLQIALAFYPLYLFWMSRIMYMNSPHSSKNNGSNRDQRLHNNNIHTNNKSYSLVNHTYYLNLINTTLSNPVIISEITSILVA